MGYSLEEQAQHRKEWVDALRSGDYKQGHKLLRDKGFCCLGVACDISGVAKWSIEGGNYSYLGSMTILAPQVCEYFGVTPEGTLIKVGSDGQETLIEMNDSGESFERIAECIDKGHVYVTE